MKDKDGTELKFGDIVRTTDAPAKVYRFANEIRRNGQCVGIFISTSGREFFPALPDGTVKNVIRVVADICHGESTTSIVLTACRDKNYADVVMTQLCTAFAQGWKTYDMP